VIEQSKKSLTTPIVKIFFSTRTDMHIPIEILDLSEVTDSIEHIEDPKHWHFDITAIQGIR